MTSPRKPGQPKSKSGKLKLKKATIKDLDVKGRAGKVKGGVPIVEYTVLFCTTLCFPNANRK